MNLSRGGIFIETHAIVPVGQEVSLALVVPLAGTVQVRGVVAWARGHESIEGPAGIGIDIAADADLLGPYVDRMIATYGGMNVLVLSGDRQDRTTLTRSMKSILAQAEVMQATDARVAESLMSPEVDLVLVDVDFDVEGGLYALRAAGTAQPVIPTVALAATKKLREQARAAGATEVLANPPPFAELQLAVVRALARPYSVDTEPVRAATPG